MPCQDVGQVSCTRCHYGFLHVENCYLTAFMHKTLKSREHQSCSAGILFTIHYLGGRRRNLQSFCCPASQDSDEKQWAELFTGLPNLRNHLTWSGETTRKVKVRSVSTNSLQTISFEFLVFSEISQRQMVMVGFILGFFFFFFSKSYTDVSSTFL